MNKFRCVMAYHNFYMVREKLFCAYKEIYRRVRLFLQPKTCYRCITYEYAS